MPSGSCARGWTLLALAREFGVTQTTAWRAIRRGTWSRAVSSQAREDYDANGAAREIMKRPPRTRLAERLRAGPSKSPASRCLRTTTPNAWLFRPV